MAIAAYCFYDENFIDVSVVVDVVVVVESTLTLCLNQSLFKSSRAILNSTNTIITYSIVLRKKKKKQIQTVTNLLLYWTCHGHCMLCFKKKRRYAEGYKNTSLVLEFLLSLLRTVERQSFSFLISLTIENGNPKIFKETYPK